MLDHQGMELKASLFYEFLASWVAAVQDRHLVFLCKGIDRIKKLIERFLRVEVFLPVGGEKHFFFILQYHGVQRV